MTYSEKVRRKRGAIETSRTGCRHLGQSALGLAVLELRRARNTRRLVRVSASGGSPALQLRANVVRVFPLDTRERGRSHPRLSPAHNRPTKSTSDKQRTQSTVIGPLASSMHILGTLQHREPRTASLCSYKVDKTTTGATCQYFPRKAHRRVDWLVPLQHKRPRHHNAKIGRERGMQRWVCP